MRPGLPLPSPNRLPPKLSQIQQLPQQLPQYSFQNSSRLYSSRNNATNDFFKVDYKAQKLLEQLQNSKKDLLQMQKRFKGVELFFEQTLCKNIETVNGNYKNIRQFCLRNF
ncbi:Hypothetical_protein [Hexamita inflata]|uniref:Hypothetical_protein n=1 Tax=Hexamita inflata TaxID=28002 RepID=A0AA86NK67_9EUKA|nr:Hypothetical protein HINF_LOCUS8488 [Hexamita inflata]